jgi:hypothetical protein
MNFIRSIAERLGVDTWVVWVGLAALVVALVLIFRRLSGATGGTGLFGDVTNGPWSTGADHTNSSGAIDSSPPGGADTGSTPSPTAPPPSSGGIQTTTRVTTIKLNRPTSLDSIAAQYHISKSNMGFLQAWNQQLSNQPGYSKTWWTLPAGTVVNIPNA